MGSVADVAKQASAAATLSYLSLFDGKVRGKVFKVLSNSLKKVVVENKKSAAAVALITAFAVNRQLSSKGDSDGKAFYDDIKIVSVIRYVANLTYDLVNPARLGRNKKDYVKYLLSLVWPKMSGSAEETRGRNQIVAMLVLGIIRTFLMTRSTNLSKSLTQLALKSDKAAFANMMKETAVLIAIGSGTSALHKYCKESLELIWRDKLTKHIYELYFSHMGYYHIANEGNGGRKIVDADERLAREVGSVTQRLCRLISYMAQSYPPILWFTCQLYKGKGLTSAMVPHVYLLLAYEVAQRLFPKNIGDLYRKQASAQGGFFKTASRVQTHSEAIAAMGGASREETILSDKFAKVSGAASALNTAMSKFQVIFNLAYVYGSRSWISSFIMWPMMNSPLGSSTTTEDIAEVMYSSNLMTEMLVANGNLLNLHATAEHMFGTSKRICDLIAALERNQARQTNHKSDRFQEGNAIRFEGVQVYTPKGVHLVKDLSFALEEGGSLLLTGHNGAGKSSIFRCLGGLWNVEEGTITKPGAAGSGLHADIFYVPQKPYNVLGSLRDQITYPQPPAEVTTTEEELLELLRLVDLEHLHGANDNTDELINWEDKLSLGEQQRLAMARLFYHSPKFAILDECTSAVSKEMERLLYDRCEELGISYITICHRPALRSFHDTNLNLTGDGKGGWEVKDIDREEFPRPPRVERRDDKSSRAAEVAPKRRTLPQRSMASKLKRLLGVMMPGSGGKMALLFGAILLRTVCHEAFSYVTGSLFDAMVRRDRATFTRFALINVAVDLTAGSVDEAVTFFQNRVAVAWHESLARHALERYFRGNAFYELKNIDKRVTDPDQRLTQEIQDLANSFSAIWGHAVTPLFDIIWCSIRLHGLVGWNGTRKLYAYIALCTGLLRLFMPNHEQLDKQEKQLESRFRFVQTRLRTHAESIAFFGGDDREKEIACHHLDELVEHKSHRIRKNQEFGFMWLLANKDYDSYSTQISVPELVTLSAMMDHNNTGNIANGSVYIRQTSDRTLRAFSKLSNLFEEVSKLMGSATRVCEMLDVMEETEKSALSTRVERSERKDGFAFEGVDIVTPDGVALATNLSVSVKKGTSITVTGPNSSGKTSFFRVLAGLWPAPRGKVTRPSAGEVFLVPQRAYSVLGSLADQVTYPQRLETRTPEDEAFLMDVLKRVGIDYLVEREGGWDTVAQWEDTMSLGEQQRMGLARLFYHKPTFGVLDECTDAVSAEVEQDLYRQLHEAEVTCVTISKRLALTEFHDKELALGLHGDGYEVRDIEK